jgi:hypothetical protein
MVDFWLENLARSGIGRPARLGKLCYVDLSEFPIAEAGSARAEVSIGQICNDVEGSESRNPREEANPTDIMNSIKYSVFAEWEQSRIQQVRVS